MKYLVTGAAGFIGFSLSKQLLLNGNEVFGIDSVDNYYDINLKKARILQLKKFKKKFEFKIRYFKQNLSL